MDSNQTLTRRELAVLTGLRDNDFDLKPGATRTSGLLTVTAGQGASFAIDAKDSSGNRLGLKVERAGDAFIIQQAEYQYKGKPAVTIGAPEDMPYIGKAIGRVGLRQDTDVSTALGTVLRDARALPSGHNASDWIFKKQVEAFKAVADQPMRFETPSHMPKASPADVLKYHLGQAFVSAPAANGGRTYTYVSDTTSKEKLVLTTGADGTVQKVELDGKVLPATRETQATVVASATEAAQLARRGDTRNNPTIWSILNGKLNNDFRHYELAGKRDAGAYLSHLQERAAVAVPVTAPVAAAAKPAAPATKPSGVGSAFKQHGRGSLGAIGLSLLVSAATALLPHEAMANADPKAADVDMSKLGQTLLGDGEPTATISAPVSRSSAAPKP